MSQGGFQTRGYPELGKICRDLGLVACSGGGVFGGTITSPRMGSGLLTTADSTTAGCSARALSTSTGPIR